MTPAASTILWTLEAAVEPPSSERIKRAKVTAKVSLAAPVSELMAGRDMLSWFE